ncbi:MAG: hypothetical protein NTV80_15505 [Verrucomicrobia bacterium]|nr:hypothetical protein [Verrucomicrobiota bacterium]
MSALHSTALAAATDDARVDVARDSLRFAAGLTDPTSDGKKKLKPIASTEANNEFGDQVLIVRQAAWEPWRFEISTNGFYTDNAALAPTRVSDFFMQSGAGLSYNNRIQGPWSFEASLRQDFIRYERYNSLDFDLTKFRTGLGYKADWLGGASFLLRYQFDHLSEPGFGSRLLDSHSVSLSLIKSWKVAKGQRLFMGLSTEPNLAATPDLALRHQHAAFAGWSMRLTQNLSARVTGRAGYNVSPNLDRNDWHYVAAVGASYALSEWASIGLTTSITYNRSNQDAYNYRNVLSGAYLGLELNY